MEKIMKALMLLFLLGSLAGCKKDKPVLPESYTIRLETSGSYYSVKFETTKGTGKVYLNLQDQQGNKTYTVKPDNNEAVTFYYSCVGSLLVKIYINDKLIINQTQPQGSHLFYLTKPQ